MIGLDHETFQRYFASNNPRHRRRVPDTYGRMLGKPVWLYSEVDLWRMHNPGFLGRDLRKQLRKARRL